MHDNLSFCVRVCNQSALHDKYHGIVHNEIIDLLATLLKLFEKYFMKF